MSKEQKVEFPVILFPDNHLSFFSMEITKFCDVLGVILLCPYPTASYIVEPLDCDILTKLKVSWTNLFLQKGTLNSMFKVTMLNFPEVFFELLRLIRSGGRNKCGIYEWNAENIDFNKIPS